MNIAIVGATGNVGRKILEVLEFKGLDIENLYLLASKKSVGKKLKFKKNDLIVEDLKNFNFKKSDISFFSAGGKISKEYVPIAAKNSIVIDNSSFFRMDNQVPLIVPQVNKDALKDIKKNIISNPNCSTAQLVIVLKPLHDAYKIKRVVVSTYQSVSGAGKAPMDELISQTKKFLNNEEIVSENFTKQIAFNIIPQIDKFVEDGYTKEEMKMVNETKKILDRNIELTATCVRIPVLISHAESVNVEFEKNVKLEDIINILNNSEGCKVIDERKDGGYITPIESQFKNETFISRIRTDNSKDKSINLWIVSDNLLRGAALNSVEIAEAYNNLK